MAIAAWKRFETAPRYQRGKMWLRRLIGQELWIAPEIDIPFTHDGGWYYDDRDLDERSVVYSLGIGDNIDFDLALIERTGATVHAFDPTPGIRGTLDASDLPQQFHSHAWAASGEDGTLTLYPRVSKSGNRSDVMYTLAPDAASTEAAIEVPAYTIASLQDKLGDKNIDILKIDIEGAEYEVLDSLLDSAVRPTQILVEFHHRFKGIGLRATRRALARLHDAGYRIFAVGHIGREASFLYVPRDQENAR